MRNHESISAGGTTGQYGVALQPIKEGAGMVKRRFEKIFTYLRHQITNAASESLNAKIQPVEQKKGRVIWLRKALRQLTSCSAGFSTG